MWPLQRPVGSQGPGYKGFTLFPLLPLRQVDTTGPLQMGKQAHSGPRCGGSQVHFYSEVPGISVAVALGWACAQPGYMPSS